MVTDRIGTELHVGDEVLLRAIVIDVHPEAKEEDGELDIRVEIRGRRFPHVALCGRDCRLACVLEGLSCSIADRPTDAPPEVAEASTDVETDAPPEVAEASTEVETDAPREADA